MRAVAVIPARWASTRFPGKPLALLRGRPMVAHVWERVSRVRGLSAVLVATDDERIAQAVRAFGGEVALTGECRTGTDRVREALRGREAEVALNVQGDEPLIEPACLESLLGVFADPKVRMATLMRPLSPGEAENPNVVKVVAALNGDALYFSRAPIPFVRSAPAQAFAHVGVYAYRRDLLEALADLPTTPLEKAEGLEQLRVLEHGIPIRVVPTSYRSLGVDVPEDLAKAEAALAALAAGSEI
ncbi:MAG TPA: 3-deoxy-manno-octulosonate cytidylyltransferase [Myxococcales bacterium]